jgi:hypothetical protein
MTNLAGFSMARQAMLLAQREHAQRTDPLLLDSFTPPLPR